MPSPHGDRAERLDGMAAGDNPFPDAAAELQAEATADVQVVGDVVTG